MLVFKEVAPRTPHNGESTMGVARHRERDACIKGRRRCDCFKDHVATGWFDGVVHGLKRRSPLLLPV